MLFSASTTVAFADSPQTQEIDVFYWDSGGSCAMCFDFVVERALMNSVRNSFADAINNGQVNFNYFNLYRGHDSVFSARAEYVGLSEDAIEMPVFFTYDGYHFDGRGALESLATHFEGLGILSNADDSEDVPVREVPYMPEGTVIAPRVDDPYNLFVSDSVIVYLYVSWCPFCYEISPIMDNLPEYVTLPDGTRSNVRLVGLNWDIPEHAILINEYHERLNIPEYRRLVPMVLIGDRDLFLYEEVSVELFPALVAGEGLTTPLFTERQPDPETGIPVMWIALSLALLGSIIIVILFYRSSKKNDSSQNETQS